MPDVFGHWQYLLDRAENFLTWIAGGYAALVFVLLFFED